MKCFDENFDDDFDFIAFQNKQKSNNVIKNVVVNKNPEKIKDLAQIKNCTIELKKPDDGVFVFKDDNSEKVSIPNNMLLTVKAPICYKYMYDLLKKICVDEDLLKYKGYYIVNYDAYKKMLHFNYDVWFTKRIQTYYNDLKVGYADVDKLTYNQFLTVLRHICHSNDIEIVFLKVRYVGAKIYYREYRISRAMEDVVF